MTDLTGGLDPAREQIRDTEPNVDSWSENMLFALHDPATGVAMWLHLGTVPNDWSMWHEMNYAVLPDGDVMSYWSYHRTAPDRRPAGANMSFECLEPFQRWRITLDGYGVRTPQADMADGLARVGPPERFIVELEISFVTQAWDMHTAAVHESGQGTMAEQGWAKEHYEQLYTATGRVQFGADELPFDGVGWRDHSQGPRGSDAGSAWGGHVITGTLYPESGRGWGLGRYWTPDGQISLAGGWVVSDDGRLQHAEVVDAPRLAALRLDAEHLPVVLRWPDGELDTTIVTRTHLWLAMAKSLSVGKDLDGPGLMYVVNHGSAVWEGEEGTTYIERSDPLNRFVPELRHG